MIQFVYHIFSNSVFSRIAWTTCWNTIISRITNIVIYSVYSIIDILAVCVFWGLNTIRLAPAVIAVLFRKDNKLVFSKIKSETSFVRIIFVAFEQYVFCVFPILFSGIGITSIRDAPFFFSNTSTRNSRALLQAAESNFFLYPAYI